MRWNSHALKAIAFATIMCEMTVGTESLCTIGVLYWRLLECRHTKMVEFFLLLTIN